MLKTQICVSRPQCVKLATLRTEFFLKPNFSSPKRRQNFSEPCYSGHFHGCPEAVGGRAVGVTALLYDTAVCNGRFNVYLVRTQKLQKYNPATRHIKGKECKITLLIDFLCLLPSQSFVFAGLHTFLQSKTRKLTVAFRCPCDLHLTFNL